MGEPREAESRLTAPNVTTWQVGWGAPGAPLRARMPLRVTGDCPCPHLESRRALRACGAQVTLRPGWSLQGSGGVGVCSADHNLRWPLPILPPQLPDHACLQSLSGDRWKRACYTPSRPPPHGPAPDPGAPAQMPAVPRPCSTCQASAGVGPGATHGEAGEPRPALWRRESQSQRHMALRGDMTGGCPPCGCSP